MDVHAATPAALDDLPGAPEPSHGVFDLVQEIGIVVPGDFCHGLGQILAVHFCHGRFRTLEGIPPDLGDD